MQTLCNSSNSCFLKVRLRIILSCSWQQTRTARQQPPSAGPPHKHSVRNDRVKLPIIIVINLTSFVAQSLLFDDVASSTSPPANWSIGQRTCLSHPSCCPEEEDRGSQHQWVTERQLTNVQMIHSACTFDMFSLLEHQCALGTHKRTQTDSSNRAQLYQFPWRRGRAQLEKLSTLWQPVGDGRLCCVVRGSRDECDPYLHTSQSDVLERMVSTLEYPEGLIQVWACSFLTVDVAIVILLLCRTGGCQGTKRFDHSIGYLFPCKRLHAHLPLDIDAIPFWNMLQSTTVTSPCDPLTGNNPGQSIRSDHIICPTGFASWSAQPVRAVK
ncbi:hypothetical protein BDK51DRAFT_53208 [Blyttiomyces helicus]|uniref:Uncharacterized protein n=1 Tax=Blyttiomyces helicus TaxID=388810 RepID=A0A4P9VTW4_9FUNG|nr:hypothetical protein BDK51DRAFT_53208 [Blyttiomyces helicus]|eukprot:RKO82981.1 hypothetical protein BDK51DRAFT_53208 [Blyttiomyces helicus]